MREVTEEGAPAIKEPRGAPKLPEATTEAARNQANADANANGQPNRAMRERATGAESPAGKQAGGDAPNKVPGVVAAEAITPLFTRPEGAPNDLKLIGGIGPKLEAELNALGIARYSQIAALTPEDVARIDAALSFRGRVTRDNWIAQAQALEKGGPAEHERQFGKKPR
jgi:NADH-quinone oxidoreductase subunit E